MDSQAQQLSCGGLAFKVVSDNWRRFFNPSSPFATRRQEQQNKPEINAIGTVAGQRPRKGQREQKRGRKNKNANQNENANTNNKQSASPRTPKRCRLDFENLPAQTPPPVKKKTKPLPPAVAQSKPGSNRLMADQTDEAALLLAMVVFGGKNRTSCGGLCRNSDKNWFLVFVEIGRKLVVWSGKIDFSGVSIIYWCMLMADGRLVWCGDFGVDNVNVMVSCCNNSSMCFKNSNLKIMLHLKKKLTGKILNHALPCKITGIIV